MAIGIINTMLLSEKAMLESYVDRLNKVEFLAVVKFLLITLIIFPVLPNQEFTQFHINPAKVWEVVIIVSTLGFVGYLLEKKFGEKVGLWLSGLLGGIVSSTAVTLSVARMARQFPERSKAALQAAMMANSMMYIRILVLIWFVNPQFIPGLWYRLIPLSAIGMLLSIRFGKKPVSEGGEGELPELQNPFEVKPAIGFALFFVVLSVLTAFVKATSGASGLMGLSALVGATDITPFILSLVRDTEGGFRLLNAAILLSLMSNTIAKGLYFGVLSKNVRKETGIRYALLAVCHIPFIIY